jgi:hypothetical protein
MYLRAAEPRGADKALDALACVDHVGDVNARRRGPPVIVVRDRATDLQPASQPAGSGSDRWC